MAVALRRWERRGRELGDRDRGRDGASYTLTAAEVGGRVRVRVTFTDEAGGEETILSEATAAVPADTRPVAAMLSVGDAAADPERFQVRVSFADAVSGLAVDELSATRVGGDAAAVSRLAEAEAGRAWTAAVATDGAGRYVVRVAAEAAEAGARRSTAVVLAVDVDAEGNAVAGVRAGGHGGDAGGGVGRKLDGWRCGPGDARIHRAGDGGDGKRHADDRARARRQRETGFVRGGFRDGLARVRVQRDVGRRDRERGVGDGRQPGVEWRNDQGRGGPRCGSEASGDRNETEPPETVAPVEPLTGFTLMDARRDRRSARLPTAAR